MGVDGEIGPAETILDREPLATSHGAWILRNQHQNPSRDVATSSRECRQREFSYPEPLDTPTGGMEPAHPRL